MAKVYMLTEADMQRLLTMIDRDPLHGPNGGSSQASVRDDQNDEAYRKAHRFYNYQVRNWIDGVTK